MKKVMIIGCVAISFGASAQEKNEKTDFKSLYELFKERPLHQKFEIHALPLNNAKKPAFTVKKLQLDNMPCLVPDMSEFNMPVAGRNAIIPNTMPVIRQVIPIK